MSLFKLACAFLLLVLLSDCQDTTGNPLSKNKYKLKGKMKAGYDGSLETDTVIFKKNAGKLRQYAVKSNCATQYGILVDLGMHSGSKRCFLVNLADGQVIKAGLVTHGSSPSRLSPGERQYSNVNGSLCSSTGMYKIGIAYQGSFGLAYKLHGLDSSNSHAYARAIVLHSHSCVPDDETTDWICQSWGCPTVAPAFLKELAGVIDKSAKPMLLYIYDSSKK